MAYEKVTVFYRSLDNEEIIIQRTGYMLEKSDGAVIMAKELWNYAGSERLNVVSLHDVEVIKNPIRIQYLDREMPRTEMNLKKPKQRIEEMPGVIKSKNEEAESEEFTTDPNKTIRFSLANEEEGS